MTNRIEALERLGRLRAEGLLTDEEFAAEKARVLADPSPDAEPTSAHSPGQPTSTSRDAPHQTRVEPTGERRLADDNDLLGPIRPIDDEVDASLLIRRVWLGMVAVLMGEAISAGNDVMTAAAGRSWASTTTLTSAVIGNVIGFGVSSLALFLLSLWVTKRASRVAAVILIILAFSATVWPFIAPDGGRLVIRFACAFLAAFGLWWLIGVARGTFWLRGRRPIAFTPSQDRPRTIKAAWAEGRKRSAPVRRIIRWLAIGWLILFVAGGAWFYLRSQNPVESLAPPSGIGPASSPIETITEPTAAEVAAPPTAAEQELRKLLIGVWVEEGSYCASYMAMKLSENGQVFGEGLLGSWTVWPGRVDIRFQSVDMDGVRGPVEQIAGAVRFIDADEFHLTEPDGVLIRYRRCVGNVEPWGEPQSVTGGFQPGS
jgi:hypothetical protein